MIADPIGFRRLGVALDHGPQHVGHPKLHALHALWNGLRGSHPLPTRDGFAFEKLKMWLGHIAFIEVTNEPRQFRVRLFGTRLVDLIGKDYTGQVLDKCLPAEQAAAVLDLYLRCVADRTPIARAARFAAPSGDTFTLEQLLLPCASDQEVIDFVVAGAYMRREIIPSSAGPL